MFVWNVFYLSNDLKRKFHAIKSISIAKLLNF